MKRTIVVTFTAALLASVLSTNVVSAHGGSQSPAYSAHCSSASAGGAIQVQARVLHADRGKSYSATATATLGGGSISVTLRRAGTAFVALGKLAVPSSQAAGAVVVTVTINYGGVVTTKTCTSLIHVAVGGSDSD